MSHVSDDDREFLKGIKFFQFRWKPAFSSFDLAQPFVNNDDELGNFELFTHILYDRGIPSPKFVDLSHDAH